MESGLENLAKITFARGSFVYLIIPMFTCYLRGGYANIGLTRGRWMPSIPVLHGIINLLSKRPRIQFLDTLPYDIRPLVYYGRDKRKSQWAAILKWCCTGTQCTYTVQ